MLRFASLKFFERMRETLTRILNEIRNFLPLTVIAEEHTLKSHLG